MAALPKAPTYQRAIRTENAIDTAIASDGGNEFRRLLLKHLPLIEDAYRKDDESDPYRSHLGASQIGKPCTRLLWYGWRWAFPRSFSSRILRLFNRGHQEEARFLAMLEMIGVRLHQPDSGGQERISDHGGHFGSALDGVLWGVPDCPGEWILGEFKTHNTKSFCDLAHKGVQVSKPEHYAQMQTCMARRGIYKTLYLAVNKNDDDIFGQIVDYDQPVASSFLMRAKDIIVANDPPPRISNDPSHKDCTYCDAHKRCHFPSMTMPPKHCRSCRHSVADVSSGTWGCNFKNIMLDKADQMQGCNSHEYIPGLIER